MLLYSARDTIEHLDVEVPVTFPDPFKHLLSSIPKRGIIGPVGFVHFNR